MMRPLSRLKDYAAKTVKRILKNRALQSFRARFSFGELSLPAAANHPFRALNNVSSIPRVRALFYAD